MACSSCGDKGKSTAQAYHFKRNMSEAQSLRKANNIASKLRKEKKHRFRLVIQEGAPITKEQILEIIQPLASKEIVISSGARDKERSINAEIARVKLVKEFWNPDLKVSVDYQGGPMTEEQIMALVNAKT